MDDLRKMKELHMELHRITNCPYTPSLKELHALLQKVDVGLLQLWARGNPCQVDYLATIVLEALELWPFAVDVLKAFASVPSFRTSALQQKPMLLETLFTNAIDSNSGFDKYAATCVALLSTPLDFAIPSNVPLFLMKSIEKAVQSLSPKTIRPVYLLLSGLESSYLDILPFDVLANLQSQMMEVLRKIDPDDHMASLLCLAVLAKFSSRPWGIEMSRPSIQSSPTPETGPESADKFLPARNFFSSRRAPKTLGLAVINSITACSQSCQLSTPEIVETLRLSREIFEAFDKKEKSSWLAGNVGKIKKLCKKSLRPELEATVQCEALNFLVVLSDGQSFPPEVIPNIRKYLLTSKTEVLSTQTIRQCIILLEDIAINEVLESLLVLACDEWHLSGESLIKIKNALRLISVFTERIPTSSKLVKAVMHSVSGNMVSDMLRQYSSQMQGTTHLSFAHGHGNIDVCPSSYHEAQAQLHHSLTVMILESALYASQCGGHFDASVLTLLLEKKSLHSAPQLASVECTQRRPINLMTPKISLFEAVSTPPVDSVSRNWRDGLIREMSRDVNCRYEGVIRIVGEVCRDLELRCNETEGPLREEQSKSRDLKARLENLERNKVELDIQAQNHQSAFSGLETERDHLANHVEATERRLKELGRSLDSIHQEYEKAKIEAKNAAQVAIESARQQDLAYLATMTGKDELLEEQTLKLASTENHAKTLEHDLNHMRGLEANNAENLRNNEKQIETLKNAVSASERRVQDLQDEICQMKEQEDCNIAKISDNGAQISELNSTIVALNEASDQNESLISHLKNQLQKAEAEISDLRLQHEMYVSAKDAELKHLDESNRSSNDKWQSELEAACRNAAAANEQIACLHSKVRELRKEREERAREFAEAQELSGRLMSLMGTTKHHFSSHGAEPRRSGHDAHDLPRSDANSPDLAAPKRFRSPRSSASSPAPNKRTKTHQASGTPTTFVTTNMGASTTAKAHRRSTTRIGRIPLADLRSTQSQGLWPTKDPKWQEMHAPKTDGAGEVPTRNDQIPQRCDSDEEFLGGGDIFTSTDQQQLSVRRSKMDDYDETTTEF